MISVFIESIYFLQNDITAILNRRNALQPKRPTAATATLERSRLEQERTLALRRKDAVEFDRIQAQLLMLEPAVSATADVEDDRAALLAQVNERNRKANLEAVRQAEAIAAEKKRQERKQQAVDRVSTPVDPSARLKTVPRTFEPSK